MYKWHIWGYSRVWHITWQPHCNVLPLIEGVMHAEGWSANRSINVLYLVLDCSDNSLWWTGNIWDIVLCDILGTWHDMKVKNEMEGWNAQISETNGGLMRACGRVKKVVWMRDRYIGTMLTWNEWGEVLTFVCTGLEQVHGILSFYHLIYYDFIHENDEL